MNIIQRKIDALKAKMNINHEERMDSYYVIWSTEHNAWWKENKCGYSKALDEAGLFSFKDANSVCIKANYVKMNEIMIPIDSVDSEK